MSQQHGMFFESIEEAAEEIARHFPGGKQRLAHRLWPNKSERTAYTRFLDCCNSDRTEHNFSGEDWLALLKIGREIGCHAVINFICDSAEYARTSPIEPEDDLTGLLREWKEDRERTARRDERIIQAMDRLEKRRSGASKR